MDRTNEPGGLRLSVTHRDDADAQTVRGRLRAYNAAALPRFFDRGAEPPRVNVYLRDEAGTLVGGITGQVEWTQLAIAYLWVDEAWRG